MLSENEIKKMLEEVEDVTITPDNAGMVRTAMRVLKEVLEIPLGDRGW